MTYNFNRVKLSEALFSQHNCHRMYSLCIRADSSSFGTTTQQKAMMEVRFQVTKQHGDAFLRLLSGWSLRCCFGNANVSAQRHGTMHKRFEWFFFQMKPPRLWNMFCGKCADVFGQWRVSWLMCSSMVRKVFGWQLTLWSQRKVNPGFYACKIILPTPVVGRSFFSKYILLFNGKRLRKHECVNTVFLWSNVMSDWQVNTPTSSINFHYTLFSASTLGHEYLQLAPIFRCRERQREKSEREREREKGR